MNNVIAFNPLPSISSSVIDARSSVDFERAEGNLKDAALLHAQLKVLIQSSVYLDDKSFEEAKGEAVWEARIETLSRRIAEHDFEVAALQDEAAQKDEEIHRLKTELAEKKDQVKSLEDDLENSSRVFQLHQEELLRKSLEIEQLKELLKQR